mmetsp:Transcript_19429/g.37423  ORF Transcript_19429/g.37423 Transcript_19429/m.37423 type:complete len:230 (+) Transcript_19429:149-838(+)
MAFTCKEQPPLRCSQHQRRLSADQPLRRPVSQSKSNNGSRCCHSCAGADTLLAAEGVSVEVAATESSALFTTLGIANEESLTDSTIPSVEVVVDANVVVVVLGKAAECVAANGLAAAALVVMFLSVAEIIVVVPAGASRVFELLVAVAVMVAVVSGGSAMLATLTLAKITGVVVVVVAVIELVLRDGHPSRLCLQHHACSPVDQALPSRQSNSGRRQARAGCGAQPRFS